MSCVTMNRIKQTIEHTIYGYNPNDFLPVWRDGKLENKGEFVAYKAEQFAGVLGHLASRTLEATRVAGAVLIDHIAQDA